MTTEEALRELNELFSSKNDIDQFDQVVDRFRVAADPIPAVEAVLRFIEQHPDDDLGAPGPLVHFVEEFYGRGYEDLLVESVRRKATELNIWMLNRLVNGSEGSQQQRYLHMMEALAEDNNLSERIRELTRELLER
jgi:hypothetical protein